MLSQEHEEKEESNKNHTHAANGDVSKKKERAPMKRRDNKASFQHKWLAGTLKNHSTPVLGIDFSPNGKYLASWSEGKNTLCNSYALKLLADVLLYSCIIPSIV